MKLKIKLFNHIVALFSLFIVVVLMLLFLVWFDFDPDIVFILSIFFIIDALPSLYLHIEYYLCNRWEVYEVNPEGLTLSKRGKMQYYKIRDIEAITIYMAPSVYRGSNLHFLSIESYYYARISMKGGKDIILTCLLTPKLENTLNQLNGISIHRKKRLFNTIYWK